MKRVCALCLVLALTLCLAVPALATVEDSSGKTALFDGSYSSYGDTSSSDSDGSDASVTVKDDRKTSSDSGAASQSNDSVYTTYGDTASSGSSGGGLTVTVESASATAAPTETGTDGEDTALTPIPALAEEGSALETVPGVTPDPTTGFTPKIREIALVADRANILTEEQTEGLNTTAEEIESTYGIELAILLITSANGADIQQYADDAYDYLGYGAGEGDSGLLLVIATSDREYAFSSYGKALEAFNDYGLSDLENAVVEKLKGDNWYGGCQAFFQVGEYMLRLWRQGEPYGTVVNTDPEPVSSTVVSTPKASFTYNPHGVAAVWYVVAAVGGFVLALIPMSGMKRQVKQNVTGRSGAKDYEVSNAFRVTGAEDLLTNKTLNRVPKPRDTQSGGSGGGMSSRSHSVSHSAHTSTHFSSSGRSHGGSHGKF